MYFYWVLWQPPPPVEISPDCCELLSNCIFTGFFDNLELKSYLEIRVVNCFQIVFLLGSLTTSMADIRRLTVLWIAFKLYFYWVLWQLKWLMISSFTCCELLSNCIFTGFFDNSNKLFDKNNKVVNCFQIVFLLGSLTTILYEIKDIDLLWIAFKLYFYWVLWQLCI